MLDDILKQLTIKGELTRRDIQTNTATGVIGFLACHDDMTPLTAITAVAITICLFISTLALHCLQDHRQNKKAYSQTDCKRYQMITTWHDMLPFYGICI